MDSSDQRTATGCFLTRHSILFPLEKTAWFALRFSFFITSRVNLTESYTQIIHKISINLTQKHRKGKPYGVFFIG